MSMIRAIKVFFVVAFCILASCNGGNGKEADGDADTVDVPETDGDVQQEDATGEDLQETFDGESADPDAAEDPAEEEEIPVTITTVYYVDLDEGDDTADGLTQATAWRHIPGTRTGATWTSDFVTSDFGGGTVVLETARIQPGTAIRIKGGTVHDSTDGGSILIDAGFYENATAEAPIVIERDPSWGSGPVTFDGTSVTLGQWDGLLQVHGVDNVRLQGNGDGGLTFQDIQGGGVILTGEDGDPLQGVRLSGALVAGMTAFGVSGGWLDGYEIASVEIDGRSVPDCGGFHFGENPSNNGLLQDCTAHNLGDEPGAQAGGTDIQIGFWTVNSRSVTYRRCLAYDNEGDGFDVGLVNADDSNATDDIKYVGCSSTNNADGYGANAGEGLTYNERIYYIGSISYGNVVGFHAYGGPAEYFYVNVLAHGNREENFHVGPDGWGDTTAVRVHLYNSIGYKPACGSSFPRSNMLTSYVRGMDFALDADYNFWAYQDLAEDLNFCCWDCYAGTDPYAREYTYENGPGRTGGEWYTLDEEGHLHCDGNSLNALDGIEPRFADEAAHDYHLLEGSSLHGAGLDLTSMAWFIPEMGFDADGHPRTTWDIGPYALIP